MHTFTNIMIHFFFYTVVKSRKSNCVKEVERLKKNREERRHVLMAVFQKTVIH